jgi:hypothetical protein
LSHCRADLLVPCLEYATGGGGRRHEHRYVTGDFDSDIRGGGRSTSLGSPSTFLTAASGHASCRGRCNAQSCGAWPRKVRAGRRGPAYREPTLAQARLAPCGAALLAALGRWPSRGRDWSAAGLELGEPGLREPETAAVRFCHLSLAAFTSGGRPRRRTIIVLKKPRRPGKVG